MIVSSRLFEDYIECATKCWLRSRGEPAAGGVYAEWARTQNEAYRQDALKKSQTHHGQGCLQGCARLPT